MVPIVASMLLVASVLWSTSPHCATVSIDRSETFQEIVGFGAHARIVPWKVKQGPFFITADIEALGFYDTVAENLSIIRTSVPPTMQESKDAPFVMTDVSSLAKLRERGITRFMATAWTPPPWMKYNNSINAQAAGDNSIKPEYYDDFGRYVATYIKEFKKAIGVDLYAVSFANEPLFNLPYGSCSYTYEEMRDMLKVAAPIVAAECPNTRLVMPEDTFFPHRHKAWLNTVCGDSQVNSHVDVLGVHGYYQQKGIEAKDTEWETIAAEAATFDKPVWQTEQSDIPSTWDGAMHTARGIQSALVHGNVSAWIWWSLMESDDGSEFGLWIDSTAGPNFYAVAHFGRFVRPGAVRIEATSGNSNVRVAAFRTPGSETAVVLINSGSVNVNISLTGAGTEFHGLRSSRDEQFAALTSVGASLTLPSQSITTLVSGQASVSAIRPLRVIPRVSGSPQSRFVTLSGRRAQRHSRSPLPAQGLLVRTGTRSRPAILLPGTTEHRKCR